MSLADELLADLEEEEDEEEVEQEEALEGVDTSPLLKRKRDEEQEDEEPQDEAMNLAGHMDLAAVQFDPMTKEEKSAETMRRETLLQSIKAAPTVDKIASLTRSKRYREVVANVKEVMASTKSVERSVLYDLTIAANDLILEMDAEMNLVNKFIRDHYAKRFPELDGLIVNPIDYTKVVQALGNDLSHITQPTMRSLLPPAQIMIVSVTATTSPGSPLPPDQLEAVLAACEMMLTLNETKNLIVDFIRSQMDTIAPNLTAMVGSYVAAKLVGLAGGLAGLAKVPACNLISLGATKKSLAGFSIANVNVRDGVISQSELVTRCPPEFYKRAMRAVAAKTILAARVDATKSTPDGAIGRKFKEELDGKVDLWISPLPSKETKALPVPLEGRKNKRGGRRARKHKEKFAMTELRRLQNRQAFGVAEAEVIEGDEMVGMGMIGAQGSGKIRATAVDPRLKWKQKQPRGKKVDHSSGGASVLGSATPYAFTPVQGIELVDTEANKRKIKEVNEKYFGTMTPFGPPKKKTLPS